MSPHVHSTRDKQQGWRGFWRAAAARLRAAGAAQADASLEAEVLLRHVLHIDRAAFLALGNQPLSSKDAAAFASLLERRCRREPLAYIVGKRSFFGLDIAVDGRVLVPRPETEGLVERLIAWATRPLSLSLSLSGRGRGQGEGQNTRPDRSLTIADIGAGSGCIAIALATHLPAAHILATDVSPAALAVARESALQFGVEQRVTFIHGDLLEALPGPVDAIVCNPPYISTDEIDGLQPEVALYEPRAALDGGPDGLAVIRRLLAQAPLWLGERGALFVEIGYDQGKQARQLAAQAFPTARIAVEQDLAGLDRYLIIET